MKTKIILLFSFFMLPSFLFADSKSLVPGTYKPVAQINDVVVNEDKKAIIDAVIQEIQIEQKEYYYIFHFKINDITDKTKTSKPGSEGRYDFTANILFTSSGEYLVYIISGNSAKYVCVIKQINERYCSIDLYLNTENSDSRSIELRKNEFIEKYVYKR